MDNYKIKVKDEAESKEAQELFFELGYEWRAGGKNYFKVASGQILAYSTGFLFQIGNESGQELTLPELRLLALAKQPQDPALISGADALRALADGKDVQVSTEFTRTSWHNDTATYTAEEIIAEEVAETDDYGSMKLFFRLKPTTLSVNAELPKPNKETQQNTEVYAVTYEFKTREERNAFADKLRGTNS